MTMKCTLCGREGTKGFITGGFDDKGKFHEFVRCVAYAACARRIQHNFESAFFDYPTDVERHGNKNG